METVGSERWRIRLLGELRATRGAVEVARFSTQKTAGLLAFLAYHLGRSHPRETLIEMLWPGGKPEAGRNSLSHSLSSLRHQLEPPGVAPGSVIIATRTAVQLNPDAVTTDVLELRAALDASMRRNGADRAASLETVVALYAGELAPGLYQDWLAPERARLRAAFVRAARELAGERRARGKDGMADAQDLLRRAVAADPIAEEPRRELMTLLAEAGEPAQALREYAELVRHLEREEADPPSAAMRELAADLSRRAPRATVPSRASRATELAPAESRPVAPLLAGTVTFLLMRGPEPALETLGAELEELGGRRFELEPSILALAFARPSGPLARDLGAASSLRVALDTREVEPEGAVRYPRHALERPLALLAAAREGQTLCSEEYAALARRELDGGRELRDLGVFRLAGASAPERLYLLGRPGAPDPEPPLAEAVHRGHVPLELSRFFGREDELASAREALRSGGARLLTVTGPGGVGKTRFAVELQRSLFLELAGESWFVPLADVREARGLGPAVATALGIELPPGREPLDVIAAALGKSPALLVLDNLEQVALGAAPFVRALLDRAPRLSCLATLRQRLGLEGERELVLSPLPVPEGDGTPESLVRSPSVRLLLDRAQAARPDFQVTRANAAAISALVRRLEGIPLALALAGARMQVLSPEQVLARLASPLDLPAGRHRDMPERHRTLRAAVEWSHELLAPELRRLFARLSVFRGGFTIEAVEAVCEEPLALDRLSDLRECSLVTLEGEGDEPRFRLLEVLRAFAAEQLAPDEERLLARRHARFFAALAAETDRKLSGPEQARSLARFAAELENLRAALDACAADPECAALGLEIAASLVMFWHVRGPTSEGRRRLAEALERAKEPTAIRAWALSGSGILAFAESDFAAAAAFQVESIAVSRALGDRKAIARAQAYRAMVASATGDTISALQALEEAAQVASDLGLDGMAAAVSNNLAIVLHGVGEVARARALCERSRDLNRRVGNRAAGAHAVHQLGELTRIAGDPVRARALFEEALADFRAVGYQRGIAVTLCSLGSVHEDEGELAKARALYEESLALARASGDRVEGLLVSLGGLSHREGALETARDLIEEGERLAREVDDRPALGRALAAKAEVLHALGDRTGARACLTESLTLAGKRGEAVAVPARLEALASLEADEGDARRAARILGACSALRELFETPIAAVERPRLGALVDQVRAASSPSFDAIWKDGRSLATAEGPRISPGILGALLSDLVPGL